MTKEITKEIIPFPPLPTHLILLSRRQRSETRREEFEALLLLCPHFLFPLSPFCISFLSLLESPF